MIPLRRASTSLCVHERRWLFWAISSPDTATPPQLEASAGIPLAPCDPSMAEAKILTARSVPDGSATLLAGLLEDMDGLLSATHIGTLGDDANTSFDECPGLLLVELVLSSTREGDVNFG